MHVYMKYMKFMYACIYTCIRCLGQGPSPGPNIPPGRPELITLEPFSLSKKLGKELYCRRISLKSSCRQPLCPPSGSSSFASVPLWPLAAASCRRRWPKRVPR